MSALLKQIVVSLILAGLFGLVFLLRKPGPDDRSALSPQECLKRFGFYLSEESKRLGIDFTHQAPTLDARLNHIMPIVASMGAAVSVVDFDRDGWMDIYVINSGEGSKNALYRNKGDGTFEEV